MVYNNLCPVCEAKRIAGEDISAFTERLKVDPNKQRSNTILVCIHEGPCSILDIGVCSCGKRGFLVSQENQIGILYTDDTEIERLVIELQEDERGIYCSSCGEPGICDDCGKHTRKRKTIHTPDTKAVCDNCFRTYETCSICMTNKTKYNPELDAYICSSCAVMYTRCSCGSLAKKDSIVDWIDGTKACDRCTKHSNCDWCGEYTVTKSANGNTLCKEHSLLFKDLVVIEGYHHTRVHDYLKSPNEGKTSCFLGIEWEAQVNITSKKFLPRTINIRRRLLATEVKKLFPEAETKRDGSLCMKYLHTQYENGVESVWQPMTFEYINKNRNKFKELFKKVKPMLHKDMPQSGMHIHISKKAFTPFHFLKFTNFFYTQEKQGFLYYMARRIGNSYSKIKSSYSYDGNKYGIKQTGIRAALYHQAQLGKTIKLYKHRSFNPERYDILNITNEHTFEIRAFKSPTKYEDFMANIEYVYAIYLYTKDVSANDMSLEDFFKYVTNNASKFPELVNKIIAYKGGM